LPLAAAENDDLADAVNRLDALLNVSFDKIVQVDDVARRADRIDQNRKRIGIGFANLRRISRFRQAIDDRRYFLLDFLKSLIGIFFKVKSKRHVRPALRR
jgi:hypothetical protein